VPLFLFFEIPISAATLSFGHEPSVCVSTRVWVSLYLSLSFSGFGFLLYHLNLRAAKSRKEIENAQMFADIKAKKEKETRAPVYT
jgi:putative aminopeptidase FrvX